MDVDYRTREVTNQERIARARAILDRFAEEALRKGWFGEITIRLTVQDGVVQHVDGKKTEAAR